MEEFKFTTKTDFEVFRDYWMFTLFEKRSANGGRSGFVKYMTILLVIVAALAVLCICNALLLNYSLGLIPVSYTHLDVYKRQSSYLPLC